MTTIKKFEDLQAWMLAREAVYSIYSMTQLQPFCRDFGLVDQIRRSSGSIMHNIAEGFESGSDAEFIRFLGYARRSASETQSQLYIALDLRYIESSQFSDLYEKLENIKRKINAFISYLHNSKGKSQKQAVRDGSAIYTTEPGIIENNKPSGPSYYFDFIDPSDSSDPSDQ